MMTLNSIFLVALGGSMGATLRYILVSVFNANIAYGTLIANGLGSFLAGVFITIITSSALSSDYKLILLVGFCGSLTTLSAISLDSIQLYMSGEHSIAILTLVGNIVLSVVCVVVGMMIAKGLT